MSTWLKPTSQLRFLFHFRRPQSLTSESDPCRQTCACRTGSCCRTCPLGASSRDPQPLPSSPSHPCRRPGRHLPERTHRFGLSCGNDHILSRPLPAKSRRGGKENIPHPSGQVTERSRSWVQARFCSEALVGSLAHGGVPTRREGCLLPSPQGTQGGRRGPQGLGLGQRHNTGCTGTLEAKPCLWAMQTTLSSQHVPVPGMTGVTPAC